MPDDKENDNDGLPDPDPELSHTISYHRPPKDARKSDDFEIQINQAEETASEEDSGSEE